MPRKVTPRPSASATLTRDSGEGGGSARSALCDEALYRYLEESPLLSEASKRTYRGGIRSLLLRAPPGVANPLLHVITHFEESERAILAADVALRTRAAWCAAVLSVFKHGVCTSAPELLAVHDKWRALNSEFSDEITSIVKTSVMSVKERERAGCPMSSGVQLSSSWVATSSAPSGICSWPYRVVCRPLAAEIGGWSTSSPPTHRWPRTTVQTYSSGVELRLSRRPF